MINIIDYTNLCSSALLDSVDMVYDSIKENLIIDLSHKEHKEIFKFHLHSQLKVKRQFGMFNVVVNSCHPNDNWRNTEKLIIPKYILVDNSIIIDTTLMETFFEQCFKDIQKEDFIFIQHHEIDLTDIVVGIDRILGTQYMVNRNMFFVIEDGNTTMCRNKEVENYIFQEIENILIDKKLI